ncbi:leucine-rich repeat-containing protein 63 [Vipera latastei]
MSQLQLLRRPLSPKMEPEPYIPKRKCTKDDDVGVQVPGPVKRNFVIPVHLTGPPSFPMQNRRIPFRLQLPTVREYPFQLSPDFVVSGVTMSLDISYNELEYIPNEIQNLRSLNYLNLEGNLLYSLPCGILKLQLSHLLVENNFLHACFWNETFLMQPQRLTDMAALCFVKHQLWKTYSHLPEEIHDIISKIRFNLLSLVCDTDLLSSPFSFTGCDCCMGPLYGKGFRFILIYRNVYGLRLPYQFSACSPDCYTAFVKSAVPI